MAIWFLAGACGAPNADTAATIENILLSIPTMDSCLDAPAEAHVEVEIRAVGAHSVEQPHQSEQQDR